jgi:hypothetical protein
MDDRDRLVVVGVADDPNIIAPRQNWLTETPVRLGRALLHDALPPIDTEPSRTT